MLFRSKLATNYVSGQINSLINGPNGLTTQLSSGITYLNNSVGSSVFGDGVSFSGGISSNFNNLVSNPLSGTTLGQGDVAQLNADGSVDLSQFGLTSSYTGTDPASLSDAGDLI